MLTAVFLSLDRVQMVKLPTFRKNWKTAELVSPKLSSYHFNIMRCP